ncbi:MAG: site-specific integrase [Thermoleophilales bacterium]|nr:site-specific integrase [Thermoleophilales bacterium]
MPRTPGIRVRHARSCRSGGGGRCNCSPSYEASVYSPRDNRKIRKTFKVASEARSWRAHAKRAIDHGELRAGTSRTLRDAAEAWMESAERGEVRNRSGAPYKPSALRGYEQALRLRVLPEIGPKRLSAITTSDLQQLVDRWQAQGLPASTIRNTIKPLQAIYRRAKAREGLPVNPTRDLELPAPRPKEVEIVSPDQAAELLAAAPEQDRAMWATALYAGLRYGELRALRWENVDLATGTIRVVESWDAKAGSIDPKTRTSRRTVPVPAALRECLLDHKLATGRECADLVFGATVSRPLAANVVYRRADKAWKAAGLSGRLRLHQARHTYASFMIAAGVNAKALASYMGHSSIKVTFDLYGHLMPGSEAEAADLLDAFLERADTAARVAALASG